MLLLKDKVKLLAPEADPVLITGPTGTGKEHIAQALHGSRSGPFLPLNCGGLPEHLIESELFGHEQGAFTDAKQARTGILRAASGGTVFLDEVAELPIHLQAKLLRAIQFNAVRPVGAPHEVQISCRFVAATKHNLKELVDKREFRDDLYARLFIFELHTTPLIPDRECDIPLILQSLGCDAELPDTWRPLVQQFNVRALIAFARRLKVLGVAHV
jgi:DNA-binding NtrC family response regulator